MNYWPRTPAGAAQVLRDVQRHLHAAPWDERVAAWRQAVALIYRALVGVEEDLYYQQIGRREPSKPRRRARLEL